MKIYILISGLIGGVIGWTTNIIAVKLLFRPYRPYSFFNLFTIQGLIPKRRDELAVAIGETVEKELLSSAEIFDHLNSREIQDKLSKQILKNIHLRIGKIIPIFIPNSVREIILQGLETILNTEIELFFRKNFPSIIEELKDSLPIGKMVENKIKQFNIQELESVVLKIARKELKHIEYLGGVLGIIIGLVQGLIFISFFK